MSNNDQTSRQQEPPPPAKLWRLDTFPGILPALPHGELTLILFRASTSSAAWWGIVGRLIEDALNAGQRVDLVRVDGVMNDDLRAMIDWNDGSGLLHVIDDTDLDVMPWHQELRPHTYQCKVPTLHNVNAVLGPLKSNPRPSMLILDHFQRARPWRGEGPPTYPDGVNLPPSPVDEDRAAQVHAYARYRKDAPTVVVWHGEHVTRRDTVDPLLLDTRLIIEPAIDAQGMGYARALVRNDLINQRRADIAKYVRRPGAGT
ncbi:hypothetical protein ACOCJ4_05735 [Knoellia sp. CPCC 206435]|uniref:hypothetical protein n=1 Tax=Knoellia terrae TaxID=3404797 RepID=UPI003B42ADC5